MSQRTIDNRLIKRLSISFFLIIVLVGIAYVLTTIYFTNRYFEESTQKLNANVANHLIDEKFKDASPFTEQGEINKAFFGDLMHDMMAVNQGIEVYLLDADGQVDYSVVLDHEKANAPVAKVNLEPVQQFIRQQGKSYILGDDPRSPGEQKIFSAAPFSKDGREGYIYIVLAGKVFDEVHTSLLSSYFVKLGMGMTILTIVFASLIGFFAVLYITRNLREVIFAVKRFKEGDLRARIDVEKNKDLSILSSTFNEMADTILENIEKVESVERLRRELIANISHDLRSPMQVIQGYVETLMIKEDNITKQDHSKYLNIINNNMVRLNKLVEQLFEYSKLEANQVEPEKTPFQITELASDVFANYQVIAQKKNISFKLDLAQKVPRVFADIALVERVFQNLMDNAIKFTPENGEITLAVAVKNREIEVTVKDSGPGISAEDQVHIFERYKQTHKDYAKAGAGIGLAIVKKIVEIHNSTIRVISKPNEGASFRFNLPAYQELKLS